MSVELKLNGVEIDVESTEQLFTSFMMMGQWLERISNRGVTISKIERNIDYIQDAPESETYHMVIATYLTVENFNKKICLTSHCSENEEVAGFGAGLSEIDENGYYFVSEPSDSDEQKIVEITNQCFPIDMLGGEGFSDEIDDDCTCPECAKRLAEEGENCECNKCECEHEVLEESNKEE